MTAIFHFAFPIFHFALSSILFHLQMIPDKMNTLTCLNGAYPWKGRYDG